MTTNIYQVVNPKTGASLLTQWPAEVASAAAREGYTEKRGVAFKASSLQLPGLVPVHRLEKNGQFRWLAASEPTDGPTAGVAPQGFTDLGVAFFAAPTSIDCGTAVENYRRGDMYRASADPTDGKALADDGWVSEGVAYWAAQGTASGSAAPAVPRPPAVTPDDPTFSIAVIPDTQLEVHADLPDGGNARFSGRAQWLVDNADDLDLRYVIHTGDVVNWDTENHEQFTVASKGMKILEDAGIENSLAIGNHDTAAVGPGGSAADPRLTDDLVRDTTTFNTYFPATGNAGIEGMFEPGKIDNTFHTFQAGGAEWLVLTLELWPRTEALTWAGSVVEAHPNHNVIINTHSYLLADGTIAQSSDYGSHSPQDVFDSLVKVYPNIRMVFSGHVGEGATREDVGVHGNKIFSYLGAFHSDETNPVRILEIDTVAGTVRSTVHAPSLDTTWKQYDHASTGLRVIGVRQSLTTDPRNDGSAPRGEVRAVSRTVRRFERTDPRRTR
ncbi:Uncharacterised protein [Arthrobacter agilis]|nr:Uncharacterised protein [Arthrobacter agilis]